MKKLLTVVLVFVFVLSLSSAVFADTPKTTDPAQQALRADIKQLVDELNGLRAEHKQFAEQAAQKRDTIKELAKTDREAGSTDKLEAAKTYQDQLKSIQADIKNLRDVKKGLWEEVKTARTNKDLQTVKDKLTQIIDYKKQIIADVQEKLAKLDSVITALQ